MYARILTIILFFAIMGLLAAQRFSLPSELPVRIAAGSGEDAGYGLGEDIRRGSVIETGNGFLKLTIGEREKLEQAQTTIWLASNTKIELYRLYADELAIRFMKGRIIVEHHADVPFRVETHATSSLVYDDTVSFVNYDFLETIHLIPLSGSVQVSIEPNGDQLLTPVPLSIHETEPVQYQTIDVNLKVGDVNEFYRWAGF